MSLTLDIGAFNGGISSLLSNFHPHGFSYGGYNYNSMEGFLQSLKFEDLKMQAHVRTLSGVAAKRAGRKAPDWRQRQMLFFGDVLVNRQGTLYAKILDGAFNSLYTRNYLFRRALTASKPSVLTHTIGKTDPRETVLTRDEFISRLDVLREFGAIG